MSETTLQYICDKVSCVYKDDRRGLIEKEIIEWIVAIGGALLIVGIVLKFIGTSYTVSGSSMYPTFQDRNKVIVSKISKTLNHIDNGDVVVFHEDAQRDFIKRVIGTPGDKVEYEGDQLYVNDKRYQSLI